MSLKGLDAYLTTDPREYLCDYCGADARYEGRDGWQPWCCTGKCGRRWRDPDAEYDALRDEPRDDSDE
jgi:hypothetical protein